MGYYVSSLLKAIPSDLKICDLPVSDEEINEFAEMRGRYQADPQTAHPELDKIRAFRLLRGLKRYVEVGTWDKFNLRYVMGLLHPQALVVDVDIAENAPARQRIESEKPPDQKYHCVVADSTSLGTLDAVKELAGTCVDAVFIDANHVGTYVMTDFALYGELVSQDGYVFFHDVGWEGTASTKGVADALDVIQRFVPVYQVLATEPVTHWYRPLTREAEIWGGVAIVRGVDLRASLGC
jgi:hypothetical protein